MSTTAITPKIPSGSTNGRGIKVAATSTPGTTIHTATSTSGEIDEITIYANNSDSSARTLTIELGGTTSPDDVVQTSIPATPAGWTPIVVAHRLTGGVVVKAFCSAANVVSVWAEVTRFATA